MPSQWRAVALGVTLEAVHCDASSKLHGVSVLLYPTVHPSFALIGLPGGPKLIDVKLYADGCEGKSGNFGAGTRFQVDPS